MANGILARLVGPATRAFFREASRAPGMTLFQAIHGYVYGRWPYLYIGIGTGEHPLARRLAPLVSRLARLRGRLRGERPPGQRITFADTYHGKVMPLEAATRLVRVQQDIRLPQPEQVIPYALARDIILQDPDHLVVMDCPCRASREHPCLPMDVCLIVGEPFASFVAEHHTGHARWITPQEAVEILQAEDARGHAHHAFFKDAMLGRFYAICNCCSCCCGAMHAHGHGTPMLASSGYVCRVDAGECVGCGACVAACPFGALEVVDGLARIDEAACMGCGVCAGRCPQEALALERAPERGMPLEIPSG